HLSVFGRKDAQQLAIIQRLVADLDLPVRIEPVEIQREPSGLARSSRNAYLSAAGREQALALSRTLEAARAAAPSAAGIRDALAAAIARAEIDWDYAHARSEERRVGTESGPLPRRDRPDVIVKAD